MLWFIYAIITGVSLGILLAASCMERGYPLYIGVLVCVAFMSVEAFLVWYFYHRIADKITFGTFGRDRQSKAKRRIVECVGVLIVLLVCAAVPAAGVFSAPEQSRYFDMAKVVGNRAPGRTTHGITDVYVGLLHLIFVFLGNKIEAGYWLQIGLLFLAFAGLYLAVRRLSGRISAFIMLLFGVFSPSVRIQALNLSPEILFLFLYSTVLLFLAFSLKSDRQTAVKWLFIGMLTGLISYLDVMGITLLFFAVGIFLTGKKEEERRLKDKIILFLTAFSGVLCGFGAALFADSFLGGNRPGDILAALGNLYKPGIYDASFFASIENVGFDIIILLCLMTFGIFSFWCNHWSDELEIWVPVTLVTLALVLFQIPTQEVKGLRWCYLFMAGMAGVGISNIFKIRQIAETEEEKRSRKTDTVAEKPETAQKSQKNKAEGKEVMGIEENREGGVVTVEFEGKTREVKLLDNPLPLPKKKAHRAMDFDYEVKDDDDFDI
ncbi:MAG: glycosyltransferase family 39 protein [Lachnoclostridium sp.]|nr:glycosyltransferase family 39 protein [Lachnoclostridium sp.]